MISEPTRITPTSRTLIDLCITSSPEKISSSGVVHLAISDHSLVFMTLKICYERTGIHGTIESRVFKNFNHHHFLNNVAQQPWNRVFSVTNPETMWDVWKKLFMEAVYKHAPLQSKRVSNKHSPWITHQLTRKIYKGVIGLPIKILCISIIKIYNACIIIHSAKCDVAIPGEEQLSSISYREFVTFRGSAVNIHSLLKLDSSGCQTFSPSSSPLPGSTTISFFLSFLL